MMSKEMLEEKVFQGNAIRKKLDDHLKIGDGEVFIYKFNTVHKDPRVYEHGILFLEKGAVVGNHKHSNDSEMYTVISGGIQCNGKDYFPGETVHCSCGESHDCVNRSNGETFVRFIKRR